jgi:thioredoxin 1
MKKLSLSLITLSLAVLPLLSSAQKKTGLQVYQGSYDNMLREAKKQNKKVLLDFYASWCAPCQKLDKETFADQDFAQFANQNVIVYKVNIETFDGMEIVEKYGVEVFPSLVLTDPKHGKLATYKGFYPAVHLQKEIEKTFASRNIYVQTKGESFVAKK